MSGARNRMIGQEREAYRTLVRVFFRHGLRAGDKLPPQETLRQEVGFSHFTLSRVMAKLVDDGVVERRPKVGTLVVNPEAVDMSAWTAALPLNWPLEQGPSPFFARLVALMQQELTAAGCHCRPYVRFRSPGNEFDRLANYVNLVDDLEAGLVDAVISPGMFAPHDQERLGNDGIPAVFATAWEQAPCGALIDHGAFAEAAVAALAGQGCRRVANVATNPWEGNRRLYEGVRQAAASAGIASCDLDTLATGLPGGRVAAKLLQAIPEAERPDGLVIEDDHIALALAQELAGAGGRPPAMAVVTHRTAPLVFALPVLHFELDDFRLAAAAVRLVVERLRNPQLPDHVEWIAPRLAAGTASQTKPPDPTEPPDVHERIRNPREATR